MTTNLIVSLARQARETLRPIDAAAQDPDRMRALVFDMGWRPPVDPAALAGAARELLTAGDQVAALASKSTEAPAALGAIATLVEALGHFESAVSSAVAANLTADNARAFARDLRDTLLTNHLRRRTPLAYELALLAGIFDVETVPRIVDGAGRVLRRRHTRAVFHPERLGALLGDPAGHLASVYIPGASIATQDGAERFVDSLVTRLSPLVLRLGGRVMPGARAVDPAKWKDAASLALRRTAMLVFPLGPSARLALGIEALPAGVAGRRGQKGPGLEIEPMGLVSVDFERGPWSVALTVTGAPALFFADRDRFNADSTARLDVGLEARRDEGGWVLALGPTHLEVGALSLFGSASLAAAGNDWGGGVRIEDAGLVIGAGEGDVFLQKLMPGDGLRVDLSAAIGWSQSAGLTFEGAAGLSTRIPINRSIAGILFVSWIDLEISAGGDGLHAEARVAAAAELGPITVVVDGVGLGIDLAFPPGRDGNLGVADLALAFLPPTGFGLALDASPIASGGGYLDVDPASGRYAGSAALHILEVGVSAMGILTTRRPDGSDGWALVVSICGQFIPIPLGFGFTLNGVGGLVAINRTMNPAVLQDGLADGSLDALLFPADPVGQAPALLALLDQAFPIAEGQYAFGPMVEIGWGAPALFTAELGILISLPDPVVIALIGQFSAVLPTAALPIVELHLDVLGVIDLGAATVSVDAALHHSSIAGLPLGGAMAFRASFVEDPGFLLAFGGFHPGFDPPLDVPALARLSVGLDLGADIDVSLQAYLGITSNTLQAGARLVARLVSGKFEVEGTAGFDALITFVPFAFSTALLYGAGVRCGDWTLFSVFVEAQLSGPQPWHVEGRAEFHFLGAPVHFHVEATIGGRGARPALDPVPVQQAIETSLEDAESWRPTGEAGAGIVPREVSAGGILAWPDGGIEVREKIVPLEIDLEHCGNAPITGPRRFALTRPTIGGAAATDGAPIADWFAPASYVDVSAREKLDRPSFEEFRCGMAWGGSAVAAGAARGAARTWETVRIDPVAADARGRGPVSAADRAAHAPPSRPPRGPFRPRQGPVGLRRARWAVSRTDTGARAREVLADDATWTEARQALRRFVARRPSARDLYQIVPEHELVP